MLQCVRTNRKTVKINAKQCMFANTRALVDPEQNDLRSHHDPENDRFPGRKILDRRILMP